MSMLRNRETINRLVDEAARKNAQWIREHPEEARQKRFEADYNAIMYAHHLQTTTKPPSSTKTYR